MSWFRVDDTLHAHRKLAKAGAEAMGPLFEGWWAVVAWRLGAAC